MIKRFMTNSGEIVRCVRIAPEMKELFYKSLFKIHESPDDPNLILVYDRSFSDVAQFFTDLLDLTVAQYELYKDVLKEEGVVFNNLEDALQHENIEERFAAFSGTLSDQLPESVGSLVFLLDTEGVDNRSGFKKAIVSLVTHIKSQWVKFLVIDNHAEPVLDNLENELKKYGLQNFHVTPDQIENSVKNDLQQPFYLSPLEKRRYVALLGGFAFGRKEYDRAISYQQKWLDGAIQDSEPGEITSAYYNIGNTQLARNDFESAETSFTKAIQLCIDHKIDSLLPIILVNLGITLSHLRRLDQAIESFIVAIDLFKSQKQLPGMAHGYDCLAAVCFAEKNYDKSEDYWQKALATYRQMTSDAFQDAANAGQKDIETKLELLSKTWKRENNPK